MFVVNVTGAMDHPCHTPTDSLQLNFSGLAFLVCFVSAPFRIILHSQAKCRTALVPQLAASIFQKKEFFTRPHPRICLLMVTPTRRVSEAQRSVGLGG